MLLVNSLILFFIFLILYQIFSYILESCTTTFTFREGLDDTAEGVPVYTNYDSNDPVMLSKQNAGNIEFLKQRLDNLEPLMPIVTDLSANMANLNDQMIALGQSQSATLQSINDSATASVNTAPDSTSTTTTSTTPV